MRLLSSKKIYFELLPDPKEKIKFITNWEMTC